GGGGARGPARRWPPTPRRPGEPHFGPVRAAFPVRARPPAPEPPCTGGALGAPPRASARPPQENDPMPDKSLEDIQDEILDRVHAGEAVDRPAPLAAHPAHVEALRRCFGLLDEIEEPPRVPSGAPSQLGEFEILREIGRGGMGIVYEARQISLKRRVALKVLPPALREDSRLLARFRREAEAAARLRHPNIVPVYSVGESGGAPFFAMELVEGRSLRDLIQLRRDGDGA